ncbi:MAG: AAA family ATPase [Eubacteriales bacterium]
MKVTDGIVIFGANGSGKTTLGHELAKALNFKHIDVENYYFDKSDIFYQHPHTKDDVIREMLADIKRHGAFVFSGVTGDYGDEIVSMFKLGIFLSAPVDLRMERIRNRAIEKHGERAMPGGDIYEDRERFIKFAQTRNLEVIDKWADTLTCPIIQIDSAKPISEIVSSVMEAYHAL